LPVMAPRLSFGLSSRVHRCHGLHRPRGGGRGSAVGLPGIISVRGGRWSLCRVESRSVGLEPFAWWCLNYVIIPFSTGAILVFLAHQLLLLYWDLRDHRLSRRRRRELYDHLPRHLPERSKEPP